MELLIEPLIIAKTQARKADLKLRVVGISKTPDGKHIYRMGTRDGRYVGRTLPTSLRAVKSDVLKIEANHFALDDLGDPLWLNPNVVSHYSDRADSWRMLQAMAGGELEKDEAPGPAGDIPPAGDEGGQVIPSGPTLAAVHVPTTLRNLSVAYAGRRLIAQVVKADPMKQLVYGVVLEPNTLDSQDDFMLPAQVEKTAHGYMKRAIRGRSAVVKLQHRAQGFRKDKPSIVPVESFVAPVDFAYEGGDMIRKGTWVMVMHVEDDALWQDFLDGKYTGFSVGGMGVRQSFNDTSGSDVPHGYIAPMPPGPQPSDSQTQEAYATLVNDLLVGGR